jgi:hypothetical protein
MKKEDRIEMRARTVDEKQWYCRKQDDFLSRELFWTV